MNILIVFLSLVVSQQLKYVQLQVVVCPKMMPPPYATLLKCDGTAIGDTCYIRCPQGWDVIGDCFKVCKSDGTWSGSEVMCLNRAKQCPPLTPPTNGQLSLPCLSFAGGYCSYTCNDINGNAIMNEKGKPEMNKVYCDELGSWNETANCNTVTGPCGPMIPPVSSYFLSTCTGSYNEMCRIQCFTGFYLVGDPILTCQTTGKWNKYKGDPGFPRCLPLPPGATPPPNVNVPGIPVVTSCPSVNPPFNGYAEGSCSNAKPDDVCKFGCNPGFILSGIGAFKCGNDFEWDRPPSATCTVERSLCFNITAVPESRKGADCKSLSIGSTCTITCQPNETPKEPIKINCLRSGWDNPYPRCTPARCPKVNPSSVSNAVMKGVGCSDGYVDDVCFFTCNPGYAMVGSGTLVCTEIGTWSPPTFPQCIQISCVPQLLPPNVIVTPSSCNARTSVGTSCSYSCGPCAIIESYANIPPDAPLAPGSGNSPPPKSGPQLSSNTPVVATCLPNGNFDKQPPICRAVFCQRPIIPLALFSANCGTCGAECIMSCEVGYKLSNSNYPRCTATGQWSGQFPTCVAVTTQPTAPTTCPVLQPPMNGYWIEGSCGGRITNCNVACYDCFELDNYQTSRYTCALGSWLPPVVTSRCLPTTSSCPDLRSLLVNSGTVINQCGNNCGTSCQYQCVNDQSVQVTKCTRQRFRETQGQTPYGQVSWIPTPFCRQAPPPPPPPPTPPAVRQCIGEAPSKGFWFGCTGGEDCNRCVRQTGQSCTLRCYDGYDLVSGGYQATNVVFTCTTSGQWNSNPLDSRCIPRAVSTIVQAADGRPR